MQLARYRRAATDRRPHSGSCLLVVSLLSALARVGAAAPPPKVPGTPSPTTEQAKQEVLTALSVGNAGHAEEILDRTYRVDPDPSLLYQLGLVAQAQGHAVAALDLYRRYQEIVGPAITPEVRKTIEHFADSLTTPYTVLNVTAPAGMLLCVDDKIVGLLPLRTSLLLGGGRHRFRLEQRGETYETGILTIPDGREAELRLTPGSKGTVVALLTVSPIALFEVQPKTLPAPTLAAVQRALVDAARKSHLAPLPQNRLSLLVSKQPAQCLDTADCLFSVAEQAQARTVLKATIQVATDREGSCIAQLEYLDVNAGQITGSRTTDPVVCAGAPLTDALAGAMQQLMMEADGRARGMVSISSVPEGAQVRIDGLLRGRTPYLKASFSGPHEIVVEQELFHPYRTQVEVAAGQVAAVQAPLKAMPKPVLPPTVVAGRPFKHIVIERQLPRPRWRLALAGIALGGGALMAGFGISALPLNDVCSRGPVGGGICDASYDTAGVGGGLLGAGLALSAGGAVLFALPGRKERVMATVLADPPSAGKDQPPPAKPSPP